MSYVTFRKNGIFLEYDVTQVLLVRFDKINTQFYGIKRQYLVENYLVVCYWNWHLQWFCNR